MNLISCQTEEGSRSLTKPNRNKTSSELSAWFMSEFGCLTVKCRDLMLRRLIKSLFSLFRLETPSGRKDILHVECVIHNTHSAALRLRVQLLLMRKYWLLVSVELFALADVSAVLHNKRRQICTWTQQTSVRPSLLLWTQVQLLILQSLLIFMLPTQTLDRITPFLFPLLGNSPIILSVYILLGQGDLWRRHVWLHLHQGHLVLQ